MRFLKQHYEKIILSIVLLGLAAAAAWLPIELNQTRAALQASDSGPAQPRPYKILDTSDTVSNVALLTKPPKLKLSGEHNIFNPVLWKRKWDGTLIKIATGKEEGPDALTIVKINPLSLRIRFDRVAGGGFYFSVAREASTNAVDRRDHNAYVSNTPGGSRSDTFTLRSVVGPPENPTGLVIELNDTKEVATVTPEKPYARVDGYSVDLSYELEKKEWKDQRLNDVLRFAQDAYKIVYIAKNEFRVIANSNAKQTTVHWNAAP
jgi:hypothetical protein